MNDLNKTIDKMRATDKEKAALRKQLSNNDAGGLFVLNAMRRKQEAR